MRHGQLREAFLQLQVEVFPGLGLLYLELDEIVRKAAEKRIRDNARKGIVEPEGPTLESAAETGAEPWPRADDEA